MRIWCLFGRHKWRFSYHHNIPLGTAMSIGDTLKMLDSGEAYTVYECTECGGQSRLCDGKRVILSSREMEKP